MNSLTGNLRARLPWTVLLGVSLAFFLTALDYPVGTAMRVGSGAFPLVTSGLLAFLSITQLLKGGSDPREPFSLRAFAGIAVGVAAFALSLRSFGLIPAVSICMMLAYIGQAERGYLRFGALAVAFAVAIWLLFAVALGIPQPAFRLPL